MGIAVFKMINNTTTMVNSRLILKISSLNLANNGAILNFPSTKNSLTGKNVDVFLFKKNLGRNKIKFKTKKTTTAIISSIFIPQNLPKHLGFLL